MKGSGEGERRQRLWGDGGLDDISRPPLHPGGALGEVTSSQPCVGRSDVSVASQQRGLRTRCAFSLSPLQLGDAL